MPVDYAALAKESGAISSQPSPGALDYTALAKLSGAVSSTPAPQTEKPGYFSQVGTGLLNAVKGIAQVGSEGFLAAIDPNPANPHAQNLRRMVIDPQVDQGRQALDSWKAGDHSEALGHAIAAITPGGPQAAQIGEKLGSGDLTGAAADATVLGGAMAIPRVAGPVARVTGKVASSAGGAAMDIAGNAAAREAVGVFSPRLKNAMAVVDRLKRAKDAYQSANTSEAPQAAPVRTATVSPAPPAVQPKALLGPGPIITPPPADASFVRSVPAEYPPSEAPAVTSPPVAATAATAPDITILDDLAEKLNGTSFAKASTASQAQIRTLAARFNQPIPAELQTPPVQTRAPAPAPEPVAPSKTLQQMLQEEMAAKRGAIKPTEAPATQPPAVLPAESGSIKPNGIAEQLRDEMQSSGSYQAPAPDAPSAPYEPPARAKNASGLAQALHDHGIPFEDAQNISMDQWKTLSKAIGQKVPSQQTIEATLVELGRLGKTAPGPNGPVLGQFQGNPAGAIKALRSLQSGEATGALSHPELGDIDLVWGKAGDPAKGYSDGYGLAHIEAKHPGIAERLPEIVSKANVISKSANRAILDTADHKAVVRMTWDAQAKQWLLTAYEKQ